MNVNKEASRDAAEYARAQMFYGEGAGTRRKLIQATVEAKAAKDPIYAKIFDSEFRKQDMAEHAQKARSERRRKDTTEKVNKNVRGVLTGNKQSVQTGVLVVGTLAYFAHQTGFDRYVLNRAQSKYRQFKRNRKARRAYVKGEEVIFDITNVK